jgi:hypothetical protein
MTRRENRLLATSGNPCKVGRALHVSEKHGGAFAYLADLRSPMTTATIPARLAADLLDTLHRLQNARADGDPKHNPTKCHGCRICIAQRKLDRLVDQLPRQETQ